MMVRRRQFRWRQVPWKRALIAGIVLLLLGVFILIALLKSSWVNPMTLIIAGLSALLASFQWLFPVSSISSQNDANIPHGIVGRHPSIDPKVIKRESAIRKVYSMFGKPEVSVVIIRGLKGSGKLTLAAQIYDYVEEQRLRGGGLFINESLWIDISTNTPFSHLAKDLFLACDVPLPVEDFNRLTPQFQAEEVIRLLEMSEPRLIVFNFNNPLDQQTGLTLVDRSGFAELLGILENEAFPSVVLLTDCPWPQEKCARISDLTCVKEYDMKGLTEAELMELLENYHLSATDEELRTIVRCSGGHVGALKLLLDTLREQMIGLEEFLKKRDFVQIWMGKVEGHYFRHIRLDTVEVNVLSALSVYRRPVPIEAIQYILSGMSVGDILGAIPKLRGKHLLRDVKVKDRYQAHPLVIEYIHNRPQAQANQANLREMHNRAAEYYLNMISAQVSVGRQRTNEELSLLKEAARHKYQSGRVQEAEALVQKERLYEHLLAQSY